MINEVFNPARLYRLALRDFAFNKKSYILLAATTGAIALFVSFLSYFFAGDYYSTGSTSWPFFTAYLFFSTLGISSSVFDSYKKKALMNDSFILPASSFEKWLLAFVKTLVIWPALFLIVVSIGLYVGSFIGWIVFSNYLHPVYILKTELDSIFSFDFILPLISTQSVFFFGAVFFRSTAFFKTALSIVVFYFSVFVWVFLWGWVFYGGKWESLNIWAYSSWYEAFSGFFDVFIWLFYLLSALFFWIMSFVRFRELETVNGF